ncbi:OmpP1/FadL family transporter [Tenacibaculum agarivorans]|uniref:OmpP1/FadL family transporter n=1 Tax=Tenacibaculum agarivorans TaxID=1908389 RepID=UPI00094BA4A0|nr:outer membrane protein transport protein [Tenacibaculum agarivorans]
MKKITFFVALFATISNLYCQFSDLNDIGILFSQDQRNGTARFNAMAGAFGALGSDVSATDINPAGAAVARKSKVSFTLDNTINDLDVNYYGNTNNLQDERFNFSQLGAILVVDTNSKSNWNRVALSFNYKLKADFDRTFRGNGNSNLISFDEHINDSNTPTILFDRSLSQDFSKETTGQNSVFNLGLSAVHDNKLYVGASLKFHSLEYRERAFFRERNDEVNGNILTAEESFDRFIDGQGFSFNVGFIYKINKFMRIGAAYESPTWYQDVVEEEAYDLFMAGIQNLGISAGEESNFFGPNALRFRTPSKLTASGAFIFGKDGLISLDYTYRDFRNVTYITDVSTRNPDGSFFDPNDFFATDYRATHALNLGAEWRFERLSVRGGYFYEQNPNLREGGNTNTDNYKGFTAGLGYNFGNTQVGLSYLNAQTDEFYSIYNTGDVTINNSNSRISASVTFSL